MSLGNVSSYYHVSRVYEYALTISRAISGKAWIKILLFVGGHLVNVLILAVPRHQKGYRAGLWIFCVEHLMR